MDDVGTFDRLAGVYDRLMPRARAGPLRDGLSRAKRRVDRVLDVGGGPGRGVRALDVPDPIVVDAAPGMLRRARARGLGTIAGDATRLPLRSASTDAVLVVDALHHMPDHDAVLAEAQRVIRPGGVLVVREFDPGTLRGRALEAGEHLLGFESTFHSAETLASRVEDAGFEATVTDRGFGYTVVGRVESETHLADQH